MTDQSVTPAPQGALPGKRVDAVHCLLMPLQGEYLLLPNAAVAEVIAYQDAEAIPDAPDWLLGKFVWRDHQVPLISFERASGGEYDGIGGARIAVLNTLNGNPRVPYIAVVLQGIPRLQLVQPTTLGKAEATSSRPSTSAELRINDRTLLIPDLDDLEQRIDRLQKA